MSTPPALPRQQLAWLALSRVIVVLLVFIAIFFIPAGTLAYWQGWLYIAEMFGMALVFGAYLFATAPDLLERRMRLREKEPTQKRLIGWAWIPFVLMFLIPGFDYRFGWSQVPLPIVAGGAGGVVVGYGLLVWVFLTNHYASRVVEVEAGQTVIATGPYALVRHPMYVSTLIIYFASPLALGSYWALVPTLALPFILVVRLLNEEEVLRRDLPGYVAYTHKTRYRLLPGIW